MKGMLSASGARRSSAKRKKGGGREKKEGRKEVVAKNEGNQTLWRTGLTTKIFDR